MKEAYLCPELELEEIAVADVVTVSPYGDNDFSDIWNF